jgi:hypothetical protein
MEEKKTMNPIYKWLGIVALIAGCVYGIWKIGDAHGEKRATLQYLPQLTSLQTVLEQGDAQANDMITNQEKTNARLKIDAGQRVAGVVAYYQRLLSAQGAAPAGSAPHRPEGAGAGGAEPAAAGRDTTITGCPVEIERRCAGDALVVNQCKEFILGHGFPIGEN